MEYLLKASAVIIIFYTCYKLLLECETFFETNRWFLLIGLLIAVIIPFVVIPIYIEYAPVVQNFIVTNDTIISQDKAQTSFNVMNIIYTVYGIGVLFFLVKLGIEFSSLLSLLKKNKPFKKGSYTFIETNNNVLPFSFFKHIVYNKQQFDESELDHIINHEKVHANQFHSIDIILIQIASTVFWFNPFIWLYKKEIQQNLEFIADKRAQTISNCEKSYQTLLLKASLPNYQFVLANNFYNTLIKKRIVMLHKSKSSKLNVWKYALVLPILAIFLMNANTKEIYIEKSAHIDASIANADPSVEKEINNILNSTEKKELVSGSLTDLKTTNINNEQSNKSFSKSDQDPKAPKASDDHEVVVINKDITDSELESIKKQMDNKGITVKFKGVKRNSKNEITAIKIDVSSKKSNANYHTVSDDPIKPISINVENDKISIGNSDYIHLGDHAFGFFSKDGNHNVHTSGKADNVFVFSGDDDDENIVIRNADKIYTSPKSTGKAHFISEDGNVTAIGAKHIVIKENSNGKDDTIHVKKTNIGNLVWVGKEQDGKLFKIKENIVLSDVGDTDTIIVKKLNKGNAVWVDKEDENNIITLGTNKNRIFFTSDEEEEPLFILNGKEITKKEMNDLKPDSIEKVEVLKGDGATEKYGDKGKNGVVLITTKDKK